jgi:glycerol-3-phosphate acyltransferase PlsY
MVAMLQITRPWSAKSPGDNPLATTTHIYLLTLAQLGVIIPLHCLLCIAGKESNPMGSNYAFWQIALILLGAYLIGSIPNAYILVRLLKGVDIRAYGSGNVGGSNAGTILGLWAMFLIGIIDVVKGGLVVWLVYVPLDMGLGMAVLAGLATTVGHDWSPFLRFNGGRGLSTIVGMLVVLFPWGALFFLVVTFIGWRLKSTAGSTVGLLGLPFLSLVLEMPPAITLGTVGMILITALKRLEANRQPLPDSGGRWPVIWRRLWLDRDVADHKSWLARQPDSQ